MAINSHNVEYYYLYRITNIINNKVYIGQSKDYKSRWERHKYLSKHLNNRSQYIHRAMVKYGINNFIFEVIATTISKNYSNELEDILIKQYNSCNKDYGYNLNSGGFSRNHSEETKQKLREATIKQIAIKGHPSKGKFRTDEQKKRMSIAQQNMIRNISDEQRKKMSESHIGKTDSEETKIKKSLKIKLAWKKRKLENKILKKGIFSENQINEIISYYKNGYSSIKIAKIYNCSAQCIRENLFKNNIKLRKYHEINHKYDINEKYFDIIDCQEKSYFLGMLFADGNVNSENNAITLKLKNTDFDLVNKLFHLICNSDVHDNGINATMKFSSKYMKNRLIELGCMPNKTLKIKFPNISDEQYSHFIRGYMDGDGCINRYKNDFYLSIASTKQMCDQINEITYKKFNILGQITISNNGISSVLKYRGNRRVKVILDWIYNGANIYMLRKYKKYLELKQRLDIVDNKAK